MKVTLRWNARMAFEAQADGHTIRMDTIRENGGDGSAPSPKQLVLSALCGCTAMDVVSILQKMREGVTGCEIDADAEQTQGQPAVFERIRLVYRVSGNGLAAEKVKQAVELSQTKYCGVSAMIARSARIDYEIQVNGNPVGTGMARF